MKKVDWKNIDQLKEIIKESKTQTEVLNKLDLACRSGNYQTLLKYIELYKIDIMHFEGKKVAYIKLNKFNNDNKLSNDLFFINGVHRSSQTMKNRIAKSNLKENICSECKLLPEWNGKKLVLQLDHINGNRLDNRLNNLRLICPNCHSQTSTFGKGNKLINKKLEVAFDIKIFEEKRKAPSKDEILEILNSINLYQAHKSFNVSKKSFTELCKYYDINLDIFKRKNRKYPSKKDLQKLILEKPLFNLGKELGLSDNGIKKYAQKNGLFLPTEIHKTYWIKLKNNKINKVTFDDLILENDKYVLRKDYIVGI